MPQNDRYFGYTSLNGLVYVVGGLNDVTNFLNVNFTYDPTTDTWSNKAPLPVATRYLTATSTGGKMYALGGENSSGQSSANYAYDPTLDAWQVKSPMIYAIRWLGSAAISGIVYTFGGELPGGGIEGNTYAYDPLTDSWANKAAMPTPRYLLGYCILNGLIYAVGGTNTISGAVTNVNVNESYDPDKNVWSTRAPMPTARRALVAGNVGDWLYAVGGLLTSGQTSTNEGFTVITGLQFVNPANGEVMTTMDLGTIVAGQESNVAQVDIWNYLDQSVDGAQVTAESIPEGDTAEISKTNNPFVADNPLSYGGPFDSNTKIGSVYVRVRPDVNSPAATKQFRLHLTGS